MEEEESLGEAGKLKEQFEALMQVLGEIREFDRQSAASRVRTTFKIMNLDGDDHARIARILMDRGVISTTFRLSAAIPATSIKSLKRIVKKYLSDPRNSKTASALREKAREVISSRIDREIARAGVTVQEDMRSQFFKEYSKKPISFLEFKEKFSKGKKKPVKGARKKGGVVLTDQQQREQDAEDQIKKTYEQFFNISDEKLQRLRKKRDLVRVKKKKNAENDILEKIEFKKKRDDAEVDDQKRRAIKKQKELKKEEFEKLREKIRERLKR
ncbi:MAG: hypothetical protein ACTSU5_21005 [Promethearchaeota archaeon]